MDAVWLEKYRPKFLHEVYGNRDAVDRLRAVAEDGSMPNLIIAGAPGIGKTTAIHCLARHLLEDENLKSRAVLELNASDERGIDVIRDKIKSFAQTKVSLPEGRHKICILDEADSMTDAAQHALCRTIEMYSNTTRFALACNQSTRVIEPIQSRCTVIRFQKLKDEEVLARLLEICAKENVSYEEKGLEALVFTAEGDMRTGINNLQATFFGFQKISHENVFKIADTPQPQVVSKIFNFCQKARFNSALQLIKLVEDEGYAPSEILSMMFRVLKSYEMKESLRMEFMRAVCEVHTSLDSERESSLQLTGLVGRLCRSACQLDSNLLAEMQKHKTV